MHFVRVFLAGEAFYFFRRVCYEQLPTSSGNIPTPMSFENLKLFGMFTQPGHVALSLLEQARHLWCCWVLLDGNLLIHTLMIDSPNKPVKQIEAHITS